MRFPGLRHFFSGLAALSLIALSCTRENTAVTSLKMRQDDPIMSARNIEVLFSDSGVLQARLTGPLMNRYGGEDPYMEFPDGFRIVMFDSLKRESTTITGNRGIRSETARSMEAYGNVVVRNELKQEQLNTEHLVWDERRHLIFSDVPVKIIRPNQVLHGTSMEADESFTRYTIREPSGEMAVKKDSI